MGWRDFRAFLAEAERQGEVRVVEGADCDLEIGVLTELMCQRNGPMLLFDTINGYPKGYRIASQPYATPSRSAIALGLPERSSPFEMFLAWREKVKNYRPITPKEVASGPVMENAMEDQAVDLGKFPTPVWHERDGGPFFGTGCAVVTRDPDEEWVNLGCYRAQLHDRATVGMYIIPYQHGSLHMRKWWAQGRNCPMALAVTPDPYLFLAASHSLPWGTAEYDYAGFLMGEPLEVIRGPRTGLPLPAHAELVLEGEVPPPTVEERSEGPFGEYTGYYGSRETARPVLRIQAVYYRSDPILQGNPPLKPPHVDWACPPSASIERVWHGLEKSGVPGIKGVYALRTGGGYTTVVAVKQQYAGHATQVGRIASGMLSSCRMVVIVEDDIDPSNAEDVLWAIATRTDPVTSFEVLRDCPSSDLDPMVSPDQKRRGKLSMSRVVINACRPWEWRDEFPPVNRSSDELRTQVYNRWSHLFS